MNNFGLYDYSGSLYAFGNNGKGQLGSGNTSNDYSAYTGISNVKDFSAGVNHSIALTTTGVVYTWGRNNHYQIAPSNTSYYATKQQLTNLPGTIVDVEAGNDANYMIDSDGQLWAWGYNYYGQLGVSDDYNHDTPTLVELPGKVKKLAVGYYQVGAILENGDVYVWGYNNHYALGLGTKVENVLVPERINMQMIDLVSSDIVSTTQTQVQATWSVEGESEGAMFQVAALNDAMEVVSKSPWSYNYTGTVSGLEAGEHYTICVMIQDGSGLLSGWIPIEKIETLFWDLSLELEGIQANAMTLVIQDTNPYSTHYQIRSGKYYVSENGELVDIPVWIPSDRDHITLIGLGDETTYSFDIVSKDQNNKVSPVSSMVYAQTLEKAPTAQMAIQTESTYDSITLFWDPVGTADSYEVEIDGDVIQSVNYRDLSFRHEGLIPNSQHIYRIRAVNEGGAGLWSSYVSAVTLNLPPEKVGTISSELTNTTALLMWEKVQGATSYDIEVDGQIMTTGRLAGYKQIHMKPNSQHVYRVRAVNDSGTSEWSSPLVVKTTFVKPGVPQNIITSVSKAIITLAWDLDENAESYQVEMDGRIIDNGNNAFCEARNLLPETTHTYRIRSVSGAGIGPWSELMTLQTYLLDTPMGLEVSEGKDRIELSWNPVEGATSYRIEINGDVQTLGNVTAYSDVNLEPETIRTYRIQGISAGGESAYSYKAVGITLPEKPGVPTNVHFSSATDQITVTWDTVEGAWGYDFELDGVLIDNRDHTYYTHDGLMDNSEHTYRVRSKTTAIEGDFTELFTVNTLPVKPNAPSEISITRATSTIVELSWEKIDGVLGYELEIDGEVMDIGTKTSYTHRRIEPNTQHRYRVRTLSIYGASDWSGEVVNNTLTAYCKRDNSFNLGVTGDHITDFSRYEMEIHYNPDVIQVQDLCGFTPQKELEPGKVIGTNISVKSFVPGTIVFTVNKVLTPGEAWVGVMNNIDFMAKVTGGTPITYTVYERINNEEE